MRIRIQPYRAGSASAKLLSETMGVKRLKVVGSRFRPRSSDLIINWGCSNLSQTVALTLNRNACAAQNKLEAFRMMGDAGVNIPDYFTNDAEIPHGAYPLVARTVLNGHSGRGIVMCSSADSLVPAPLYTKYIKKEQEYRVHVMNGRAFFVQRKARKRDVENPNWQIRNLAGGFVFVMCDMADVQANLLDESVKAMAALGLDFGAVDVILGKDAKAYVLEVNTACGLEERTAKFYADAFREEYLDHAA